MGLSDQELRVLAELEQQFWRDPDPGLTTLKTAVRTPVRRLLARLLLVAVDGCVIVWSARTGSVPLIIAALLLSSLLLSSLVLLHGCRLRRAWRRPPGSAHRR